jgi:hypothetical protein
MKPGQLVAQGLTRGGVGTDQIEACANLAPQLRMEAADKLGDIPGTRR